MSVERPEDRRGRAGQAESAQAGRAESAQGAQSQWLRGVTDLLLLACLDGAPSYGYALLETLVEAGIEPISEATVYGALRRLETSGLCISRLVASESGPARRYYELTARGRAHLDDLRRSWIAFSGAVDTICKEHP